MPPLSRARRWLPPHDVRAPLPSDQSSLKPPRCPCGAQFCYACGLSWKTCPCPQWSEERLFARATQVVARRPAHANPQAQFATAVQNLRDRHDCNHLLWLYVRGRHQCEECRQTLPTYIFECRQCNIQACNRCRRNRL